jgi:ParB-like chromosome segregation protein Spo0J
MKCPRDLLIQWRDPWDLTPAPGHPKAHPEVQVRRIAASIGSFTFDQPIVVDGKDVIVKGHGRREAAIRLGLALVPVLVREDLDQPARLAAALADNKSAESHWLPAELAAGLGTLLEQGRDCQDTGFSREEVQGLVQAEPPPKGAYRRPDQLRGRALAKCPHCGRILAG